MCRVSLDMPVLTNPPMLPGTKEHGILRGNVLRYAELNPRDGVIFAETKGQDDPTCSRNCRFNGNESVSTFFGLN